MNRLISILTVSCMVLAFSASAALAFPAVEVYQKTSKSVVLIVSGEGGGENMVGAGSVVTPDGHIITNAHVVIDKDTGRPYKLVRVFIKPEEVTGDMQHDLVNRYKAKVIAYDSDLDLALVQAYDLPSDVLPVALANPRDIMIGEEVVAIGHPEQGGLWTLTYGRISGQIANQGDVRGKDVYQTDTSVNRGNSGGPLLDRRGYIVGVNTNIARVGAGNLPITGVNFALKSGVVENWLADEGYKVAYGTAPLHPEAVPATSTQTGTASEVTPEQATPITPTPEKIEPGPKEVPEQATPITPTPEKIEPGPKEVPEQATPITPTPENVEPFPGEPEINTPVKNEPAPGKDELGTPGAKSSDEGKMGEDEFESDEMITPKRPFSYDDLFQEVEKEMENIMDEMRMKIRHR
jgi:serine protease Do